MLSPSVAVRYLLRVSRTNPTRLGYLVPKADLHLSEERFCRPAERQNAFAYFFLAIRFTPKLLKDLLSVNFLIMLILTVLRRIIFKLYTQILSGFWQIKATMKFLR